MSDCVALKRAGLFVVRPWDDLFRSSVLGDRLGTFADGVLGQLSGEEKADCCLYFTAADGRFLVVLRQARCFGGDALEDVIDEAVHDWHRTTWDASVGMDLFENLVDVNAVALFPLPMPLLAATWTRSLGGLLGTFLGNLTGWSHCELTGAKMKSKIRYQWRYGMCWTKANARVFITAQKCRPRFVCKFSFGKSGALIGWSDTRTAQRESNSSLTSCKHQMAANIYFYPVTPNPKLVYMKYIFQKYYYFIPFFLYNWKKQKWSKC